MMLRFIILFCAMISVSTPGHIFASSAEIQWHIANSHFNHEEWQNAEKEFLRYSVLYPRHIHQANALNMRALSLWYNGERGDAMQLLSQNSGTQKDISSNSNRTLLFYTMLLEQELYSLASFHLQQSSSFHQAHATIQFLQGWNFLLQQKTLAAQLQFASIQDTFYAQKARVLLPHIRDLAQESLRSPLFAGALSFMIPGAGQAYCGNTLEALGSLAINTFLGFWLYNLIQEKHYKTAGSVYLFSGIRYHWGGARQAYRSAQKINKQNRFNKIIALKRDYGYPLLKAYTNTQ